MKDEKVKNHMLRMAAPVLLGTALFFLSVMNVSSANLSPFYTQNQSPLAAVYGLPFIGEAKVMARGEGLLRLTLDLANTYITDENAREQIVLDGESLRLTFSGRYGIGRKADLGIDVPFWVAGGGFLDGFIEGYHSIFGFPNGGRELAPRNRLLYRYRKDGVTLLNREQSGQGPGDVSLTGGWQIFAGADQMRHVSVRASLKLSTGDADTLRGSGSTDLAVWLLGDIGHKFSLGKLTLVGAAGAMGMTRGRILPDQQRPCVGFGVLMLGFSPSKWIDLKIQTNAHTSFYSDSDLKQINAPSAQLTMGGALHFSPKTSLDIGVTEDIIVGASPDVVFHLSLQHAF
jgi:hypothetical protein